MTKGLHIANLVNLCSCTKKVYTMLPPNFGRIWQYHIHACIYITHSVSCHVHTQHIRSHTVFIQVRSHTMFIHVHTLYIGTTHYMHLPLRYTPLCNRLNSGNIPCNMYVLCYRTGTSHYVQTRFRQGYTSQEWFGQVGSFPVAFSVFSIQTSIYTVDRCTNTDIRVYTNF